MFQYVVCVCLATFLDIGIHHWVMLPMEYPPTPACRGTGRVSLPLFSLQRPRQFPKVNYNHRKVERHKSTVNMARQL
jgi:hypothetical protein